MSYREKCRREKCPIREKCLMGRNVWGITSSLRPGLTEPQWQIRVLWNWQSCNIFYVKSIHMNGNFFADVPTRETVSAPRFSCKWAPLERGLKYDLKLWHFLKTIEIIKRALYKYCHFLQKNYTFFNFSITTSLVFELLNDIILIKNHLFNNSIYTVKNSSAVIKKFNHQLPLVVKQSFKTKNFSLK